MSHTPLLPGGTKAGGSLRNGANRQARPTPRGLPAGGATVSATCPAGTLRNSGPGEWETLLAALQRNPSRERPLPGGGGMDCARRYLVGSRRLYGQRREMGK